MRIQIQKVTRLDRKQDRERDGHDALLLSLADDRIDKRQEEETEVQTVTQCDDRQCKRRQTRETVERSNDRQGKWRRQIWRQSSNPTIDKARGGDRDGDSEAIQ